MEFIKAVADFGVEVKVFGEDVTGVLPGGPSVAAIVDAGGLGLEGVVVYLSGNIPRDDDEFLLRINMLSTIALATA